MAPPSSSKSDEAEYALLDSIFADLEETALTGSSLQTHNKATRPKARITTDARSNGRPVTATARAHQPTRSPLAAVTGNSVRAPPQRQWTSKPAVLETKVEILHKPSQAFRSKDASSQPIGASRPAQQQSVPRHRQAGNGQQHIHEQKAAASSRVAPKQDDATLLDGVEWSDSDGEEAPAATTSVRLPCNPQSTLDAATLALYQEREQPDYVPHSKRFTRCQVLSITEKVVKDFRREKTVIVEVQRTKECRRLLLFDEWATTEVEQGDIVNVIGRFERENTRQCLPSTSSRPCDNDLPTCKFTYSSSNLLVVNPDTLISATRASDAHYCRRKAVVQEKVRSASEASPALVYGNLLHELFQSCLLAMTDNNAPGAPLDQRITDAFSLQRRETHIDHLLRIPKNIESLFTISVELDEARAHLRESSVPFSDFAKLYLGQQPKSEAYLNDPRSRDNDPTTSSRICISGVSDIEEDIWSPRLGLKGKVDASVQAAFTGPPSPAWPLGKTDKLIMPFEIKTGRKTSMMQHRAQTMLYTQMMSDRYDRSIASGLLYYTQTNSLIRVEPVRNELRGLMIARNDMARYLTPPKWHKHEDPTAPDVSAAANNAARFENVPESLSAPPNSDAGKNPDLPADEAAMWADIDMEDTFSASSQPAVPKRGILPAAIDEDKSCVKCYAAASCMLYRRAVEKVQRVGDDESRLQQAYDDRVGHLTEAECQFFESWENLISLEEREMVRFKKEIWTMSAEDRERHGRCFANMILDPSYTAEPVLLKATAAYRYTYRLVRSRTRHSGVSFQLASQSQQPPSSAQEYDHTQPLQSGHMAVGDSVVVSLEPSVIAFARGFIVSLHPQYIELGLDHSLALLPGQGLEKGYGTSDSTAPRIFRIDKDELQTGMAKIRENLAQLFYHDGHSKLLKLIVDLDLPRFSDPEYKPLTEAETASERLNQDQIEAVDKVLRMQDYALILGMPGTGKTTTIAAIIKLLALRGKSILLTSYTHSAVDNILIKIKDADISILRLGNVGKILPAVAHFALAAQEPPGSIVQLEHRLFSPQVVATTALGIDHPIFSRRKFDYCIVDEASQITLPTCLGPLRSADKFILVGDHNQLPPLVKNLAAREGGLEVSLFRRLSEAQPSAVVHLKHQYRMNADIMSISNRLVYNEALVCGSDELASRSLAVVPPLKKWTNLCSQCSEGAEACWIRQAIQPRRNVVFLNTDGMPAPEERLGRLVQNTLEARLVHEVVTGLVKCGVKQEQIAAIALYRQQLSLLQQRLTELPEVEILTADKSQGRDKDCIVMSLTRSNAKNAVGDLIKDWRRLNVCFTRARYKLVVIGSRKTLQHVPHMAEFFSLVDEKGWQMDLDASALRPHGFQTMAAENHPLQKEEATQAIRPSSSVPLLSLVSSSPRPLKRPASTAPPVTSTELMRSGGLDSPVEKHQRPSKTRKVAPSKSDNSISMGAVARAGARPILRDILNAQ